MERDLLSYRPLHTVGAGKPDPAAPKPDGADEVLRALAQHFDAGDRVGCRAIEQLCGVRGVQARAVRRWAIAARLWPYRDALSGFQAHLLAKGGAR